jgi:hypothetical protein
MKLTERTRWVGAALALAVVFAAGCTDGAKPADPKPVNVKEDPRLKRAGDGPPGGQSSTAGQLK